MNIKEAFKILDLNEDASKEDVKAKYRELAKRYHPDVCKENNAADKFKKINEANDVIKSYHDGTYVDPDHMHRNHNTTNANPFSGFGGSPFGGFNINDVFSNINFHASNKPQSKTYTHHQQPIVINSDITFKESITGVTKSISFKRKVKCENCDASGFHVEHNGCSFCDGFGVITNHQGSFISKTTCHHCAGKQSKKTKCKQCDGSGLNETEVNLNVRIPAGVKSTNMLRLGNMGNFIQTTPFNDLYGEAFVQINVTDINNDVRIEGPDVISDINIALKDAVFGTVIKSNTVYSEVDVNIPKRTKHKDVINIPNHGLANSGNHKFVINVDYPDDVESLFS